MRPVRITKALATASTNNICLSQTPAGAGDLVLTGSALYSTALAICVMDSPRVVLFTFAGDEHTKTFVVYGNTRIDGTGNSIQETLTGVPSGAGTASTTLNFGQVSRISVSAATAGALTVGTSGVGSTEWQLVDTYLDPTSLSIAVDVTGTVNYTVQYTYDNIMGEYDAAGGQWANTYPTKIWNDTTLNAVTTDGVANVPTPLTAWRVLINSSTSPGAITVTAIQAGVGGIAS